MIINVKSWLCAGFCVWICSQTPVWAEDAAPEKIVSSYLELDPEFITNFQNKGSKVGYVRVGVSLKLANEKDEDLVEAHLPLIRNSIVGIIYAATDEQVRSNEAQEQLRQEIKAAIQTLLKEETGKEMVQDVLFTHFLWQ